MGLTPADRFQVLMVANDLTGGRPWTRAGLDAVGAQIVRAGAALGVVDEVAQGAFVARAGRYQRAVIGAAFDAEARRLLGGRPTFAPYALERTGAPAPAGTALARLVPAVDVNDADAAALARLPGLGPKTAARIVARRADQGPYRRLADARAAAGASKAAWDRATPYLALGPGGATATGLVAARLAGFRGLLEAAESRAVDVAGFDEDPPDPVELVRLVGGRIAARPRRPRLWGPSPARLRRGEQALRLDEALPPQPAAACGLVRSQGYLPFVTELLAGATERVRVTMFFFAAGPRGGGRALLAALVAAAERGVDVRVILDDDLPGDVHGARRVNAEAFDALRAAGIAHRHTHLEVTTHEKTLVVDGRHVVAGSHNWTGSSLYVDDETSVYADAPALAAQLDARFDRRFALLAPRARDRRIALEELELLTPAQRAALAGLGVRTGRELASAMGGGAAAERALGRDADVPVARLRLVRDAAELMAALRIAERTAALLVAGGLRTPARARAASRAALRRALERPDRLPEPLTGRGVNPDVAERIARA